MPAPAPGRLARSGRFLCYDANMIVFLGGFFGSGRASLAQKLAMRHGLHCLDLYGRKERRRVFSGGKLAERVREPETEEEHMHLYERLAREFPLLSKMYPDIIIHDSFHLARPRDYLIHAVRTHFGEPKFVWIEASDERAQERFARLKTMSVIRDIERAVRLRRRQQRDFEPFEREREGGAAEVGF